MIIKITGTDTGRWQDHQDKIQTLAWLGVNQETGLECRLGRETKRSQQREGSSHVESPPEKSGSEILILTL